MTKPKTTATKKTKISESEYAIIGKAVADSLDRSTLNTKDFYIRNLVRGIVAGFGSVLGATLFVALFIWFLSLFDQVPLIGGIAQKISDTVNISK